MTTDKKVLYSCSVILTVVLLGIVFIPKNWIGIVAAAFSAAAAVLISRLIRKRTILSINKDQILLILAAIGALYVMGYYLSGLKFGFFRASPLSPTAVVRTVLPIPITIIAIEIIRSILLAQRNKLAGILAFGACVISELLISGGLAGDMSHARFLDVTAMTLFPAITSNLLYHYVSRRYGSLPVVVYRILTTLFLYLIPIRSGIPDSIVSFVNLLLPLAIYFFIDLLYEKKRKYALGKNRGWIHYAAMGFSLILMTSIVMLVSCQFRFGVIVIATESMTGSINKGDAVVFEKYNGQAVSEGDVIIFDKDGRTTVHRVVEIERIDGVTRYYTKGDANDSKDRGFITEQNIEAVTKFKVSYVGYPTLWLRDIFK